MSERHFESDARRVLVFVRDTPESYKPPPPPPGPHQPVHPQIACTQQPQLPSVHFQLLISVSISASRRSLYSQNCLLAPLGFTWCDAYDPCDLIHLLCEWDRLAAF